MSGVYKKSLVSKNKKAFTKSSKVPLMLPYRHRKEEMKEEMTRSLSSTESSRKEKESDK